MRKHLVILAAFMTAVMITACGNGDGIVINGTTAADSESSAAVTEEGESETSEMTESTNGAKIEIITGETEQGAGTESAAESLEGQTEYQTTQAPAQAATTAAPATAAPTTAAPKATTAASTTAAQYEVKDVKKTMYATSSVRVRSSYSTNSEVLGALGDGEKIEVTGESSNGWMRVNYKGHTAYVSKSYLTDTQPAASTTAASNQTSKPSSTVNSGTTPGKTPGPAAGNNSGGSATGPSASGSSSGNVTGPGSGTNSSGNATGPGGSSSNGNNSGPGSSGASSGSAQSGSTGTVTGTVVGLDPTGVTVQTGDGTSYQFVWGSDVPALSTGEKVQISYGVDSSGQRQIKQVVK